MRPLGEWADLMYFDGSVAHWVPFGDGYALCGASAAEWWGTGTFDEIEYAAELPRCTACIEKANPTDHDAWLDTFREGADVS